MAQQPNLDRWLARMTQKQQRVEDAARLYFIALVLEAHELVVQKTPVDTGFLRSMWGFAINDVPPMKFVPRPRDAGTNGPPPVAAIEVQAIAGLRLGDVAYLYNPVVYAPFLENGTPRMAPVGMVAATLQTIQVRYRNTVRRAT